MFSAPPGYDDLTADAARAGLCGMGQELLVPGVGVVVVSAPAPRACAALAAASRPRVDAQSRAAAVQGFVADHLHSPALADLYADMIGDALPDDTLGRVARAVATCGTSRPYLAVSTLAAITGHNWRLIRAHLIEHGVPDPMTSLPSLHALLDVTEQLVLSSMQGSTVAAVRRKRDQFLDSLYAPERVPADAINGPGYDPLPPGFSDEEMQESFDIFASHAARSG